MSILRLRSRRHECFSDLGQCAAVDVAIRPVSQETGGLREKVLVHMLYAVALGLLIVLATDGFTPDLLRPFIKLLQWLKI